MHENEMWGLIPSSFYDLKKMKSVWFQDTLLCDEIEGGGFECNPTEEAGFQGSIQTEIGNLKQLSYLLLNNNPLTGTLPTEIGLLENLCEFDYNNQFVIISIVVLCRNLV